MSSTIRLLKGMVCSRFALLGLGALGLLAMVPDHAAIAAGDAIDDGGFEAGRNAGIWKETSTNFGTPICSFASCGDGTGTAGPRGGSYWAWFGGASTKEEKGSLTQTVKFPSGGAAKLRFYLWIGASSPDGKDYVKILIDGQKVFSVKENSTKYGAYTLVTKDVGQFADGQKHKIQFKNKCSGDGSSNFNVDDVSLTAN